ncbi:MAG: HD domain-containing protein [Oscillospiraceae bacterium]|nr:HD domain-containing protein [Oscillospiraceae bacterium]
MTGKVMAITFAFFTFIYILNLLGIFIIDRMSMTTAYIIGSAMLLLPLVMNKVCDPMAKWLKYFYVTLACLFLFVLTTTLTYHVVLVYAYPIAIAGMYFSKRLTRIATAMTAAATVFGQICGFYLGWRVDDNFPHIRNLVLFGILPRLLLLISFSALLQLLTKRTSQLLKENAENYDQLVLYNRDMIYGFATLVENRDESTGGHIKRTSIYVRLLAEELQRENLYSGIITDDYIECLSMVAPLHDIGKIAIPDSILQKPGRLTEEEFEVMKTHTVKGGQIIKETFAHINDENYKEMAYKVARSHHEKWNGKGYPDGLSGEDIPLSARIMSIADVFDAVSEKRCYRDAMPLEKCFGIIEEGRGKDFDPVLTDAFMNIRDEVIRVHNKSN